MLRLLNDFLCYGLLSTVKMFQGFIFTGNGAGVCLRISLDVEKTNFGCNPKINSMRKRGRHRCIEKSLWVANLSWVQVSRGIHRITAWKMRKESWLWTILTVILGRGEGFGALSRRRKVNFDVHWSGRSWLWDPLKSDSLTSQHCSQKWWGMESKRTKFKSLLN